MIFGGQQRGRTVLYECHWIFSHIISTYGCLCHCKLIVYALVSFVACCLSSSLPLLARQKWATPVRVWLGLAPPVVMLNINCYCVLIRFCCVNNDAGYVPAKLPTSLTALQAALFAVNSVASLEIMEKLMYNATVNPSEPKFKKVGCHESEGVVGLAQSWSWKRSEATRTSIFTGY